MGTGRTEVLEELNVAWLLGPLREVCSISELRHNRHDWCWCLHGRKKKQWSGVIGKRINWVEGGEQKVIKD